MEQQHTAEANRQAILNSPSYRLAEYDFDFLKRDDIRHVRMTLELLKTETLLRDNNVKATVVVFGSARIVPQDVAELRLREAREVAKQKPRDAHAKRAVERAEQVVLKSRFYEEARQFGRLVSTVCQIEARNDFVIATGGGPGIMEAANRGAFEIGAKSVGFNIDLPHEQEPNPYITPDLCFRFHYFAIRKFHFILRAKALVIFPGGFGTLDELFDTLCLRQTRRMQAIPIILYGREYWESILNFPKMADEGVIDDDDLKLISWAESPEEAWKIIADFHGVK
ncbi:MAG: LOG family protein [Pirellulales bacterium]